MDPATRWLLHQQKILLKEPLPFVTVAIEERNILLWHFAFEGPPDSPFAGGCYHGTLHFSQETPIKPPSIRMLTPNGRFETNARICLDMASDFHPEKWRSTMSCLCKPPDAVGQSLPCYRVFFISSWTFPLRNTSAACRRRYLGLHCSHLSARREGQVCSIVP